MKYTYPAIFTDDKDTKTCHVEFPNLHYGSDIAYSDKSNLMREAEHELGFALWLFEDAGREFPKSEAISDKGLPSGTAVKFVSCDYEKYRRSVSVKVFDL